MRKIIHVDMDAFYASVEQRDSPELRGQPVIVAWSGTQRSVVVAASYEARKFGVHSAMPISRARRLAPQAIHVPPNFDRYRAISRQIRAIFQRHTPLVEPLSLDEAYLDVTEELTGIPTATETAAVIRLEIRAETGLTASAGVAPNKFLAKIASDWKKPDGLFVIKPHQVDQFLAPLPVGKIPGVGKVTEKVLHGHGLLTIGNVREIERTELVRMFGKFGDRLWELARGIDEHPVIPAGKAKSISMETTFETDSPLEAVAGYLSRSAPELWENVERKGRVARTVTVKLRTGNFRTATRQHTPPSPPSSASEFTEIALGLLNKFEFPPASLFRLAGVGLSNFTDESEVEVEEQELTLWDNSSPDEKLKQKTSS